MQISAPAHADAGLLALPGISNEPSNLPTAGPRKGGAAIYGLIGPLAPSIVWAEDPPAGDHYYLLAPYASFKIHSFRGPKADLFGRRQYWSREWIVYLDTHGWIRRIAGVSDNQLAGIASDANLDCCAVGRRCIKVYDAAYAHGMPPDSRRCVTNEPEIS